MGMDATYTLKVGAAVGNLDGAMEHFVDAQQHLGLLARADDRAEVLVLHVLQHKQPRLAGNGQPNHPNHSWMVQREHHLCFAQKVLLVSHGCLDAQDLHGHLKGRSVVGAVRGQIYLAKLQSAISCRIK